MEKYSNVEMEAVVELELDLVEEKLYVSEVELDLVAEYLGEPENYSVNYLMLQDLRSAVSGLPVKLEVRKDNLDELGYYDSYDETLLFMEYWEDEDISSYFTGDYNNIRLELDNKETFINDVRDNKLPTEFYPRLVIKSTGITLYLSYDSEKLIDKKLPYLQQPDIVTVLKSLMSLDNEYTEEALNLHVKEDVKRVTDEDIDKEFIENIRIMNTHEEFNNLIKERTIQESDELYIYLDTYKKTATLHRLFKGAYYNSNTVSGDNMPLTLTTQYELEEKSFVLSSANKSWAKDSMNGRMQRELKSKEDYHKFSRFIRRHFPSLKTEDGGLQDIELSIRLVGVEPKKEFPDAIKEDFGVIGDTGRGLEIVAHVEPQYTHNPWKGNRNGEVGKEFYKEYVNFIKWLEDELQ